MLLFCIRAGPHNFALAQPELHSVVVYVILVNFALSLVGIKAILSDELFLFTLVPDNVKLVLHQYRLVQVVPVQDSAQESIHMIRKLECLLVRSHYLLDRV